MYGALSELLYLCNLEEQRSGEWGGFKAIWVGGEFLWDGVDPSRHHV